MFGARNIFHFRILRKYIYNLSHVVDYDDIEVNENMTYKVRPVRSLDHGIKKLQNKDIALVKVQWNHYDENKGAWEVEANIITKYPELFQD